MAIVDVSDEKEERRLFYCDTQSCLIASARRGWLNSEAYQRCSWKLTGTPWLRMIDEILWRGWVEIDSDRKENFQTD